MKYQIATDTFADYIVHEAAHVFHSFKRAQSGVRETRTHKFLLNVNYHQSFLPRIARLNNEFIAYAMPSDSQTMASNQKQRSIAKRLYSGLGQIGVVAM